MSITPASAEKAEQSVHAAWRVAKNAGDRCCTICWQPAAGIDAGPEGSRSPNTEGDRNQEPRQPGRPIAVRSTTVIVAVASAGISTNDEYDTLVRDTLMPSEAAGAAGQPGMIAPQRAAACCADTRAAQPPMQIVLSKSRPAHLPTTRLSGVQTAHQPGSSLLKGKLSVYSAVARCQLSGCVGRHRAARFDAHAEPSSSAL